MSVNTQEWPYRKEYTQHSLCVQFCESMSKNCNNTAYYYPHGPLSIKARLLPTTSQLSGNMHSINYA